MMRILENNDWNNYVILKLQTPFKPIILNQLIAYCLFSYTIASISLQCLWFHF